MTDTTNTLDLDETPDLAELRALRAEQSAKQTAAGAHIAQLDKLIQTRVVAAAAGEVEILTPETPDDGDGEADAAPQCSCWDWARFCRVHPRPLCDSPHPAGETSCKRFAGHDGDHAAYTFRLSAPET